ncbi:hypothetical protein EF915_24995 [Streptomyces sp. WAC08401]|nr:hypothetical protein EF915_24995 [Streptomyces sp. WAC08401]
MKRYEVTTPHGVQTTMKLSEADAERLGVLEGPGGDSTETSADEEKPAVKKRAVSNKARTAASKGGAGGGDD